MPKGLRRLAGGAREEETTPVSATPFAGLVLRDYSYDESVAILIVHSHVKRNDFVGRDNVARELASYSIENSEAQKVIRGLVDVGALQEIHQRGSGVRAGFDRLELRAGLEVYADMALGVVPQERLRPGLELSPQQSKPVPNIRPPSEGIIELRKANDDGRVMEVWKPSGRHLRDRTESRLPYSHRPFKIDPVVSDTFMSKKKRFSMYTNEETGILLHVWAHTSRGESVSREQVAEELSRAGFITEQAAMQTIRRLDRCAAIVEDTPTGIVIGSASNNIKINPSSTAAKFAEVWFRVGRAEQGQRTEAGGERRI